MNISKAIQDVARKRIVFFYKCTKMYLFGPPRICRGFLKKYSSTSCILYLIRNRFDKKRNMDQKRQKTVQLKVEKLLKANFIREVRCPQWLSNTF
jgi:cytidine deaminase